MTSHGQAWQGPRGCGPLLRRWRELRRLTQLDLALDAGISARHLSYIETGKTLPSREMLLALAQTLDLPLRERNLLFLAAGYAPLYQETPLTDARMNEARTALQLILRQHEPYSAFACDRYWNLVMANDAYLAFLRYTVGARAAGLAAYEVLAEPRLNVLHLIFEDGPLRKVIVNWQEVAKALLEQVQRTALWTHDHLMHGLIAELLAYPGVPRAWREPELDTARRLLLPCELTHLGAAHNARMFSTMTTLSGPQDITLQDLHIEAFYPADAETAALIFYQA
ncbi:MAG: helix-turn-helix transcriptional regulator [Proteobacteria bacterium]|nr:helix-turn-helix transcriptional regulator [Pseudomonadota bacterium]